MPHIFILLPMIELFAKTSINSWAQFISIPNHCILQSTFNILFMPTFYNSSLFTLPHSLFQSVNVQLNPLTCLHYLLKTQNLEGIPSLGTEQMKQEWDHLKALMVISGESMKSMKSSPNSFQQRHPMCHE